MKVVTKTKKIVELESLKPGDVFTWKETPYLATTTFTENGNIKVVNLISGELHTYGPRLSVTKVDAVLYLEEIYG